MALGRETLDGLTCAHGDSGPGERLWLHPRCHSGAGTWSNYQDGVVRVQCKRCAKLVVEIAVADKDSPAPAAGEAA